MTVMVVPPSAQSITKAYPTARTSNPLSTQPLAALPAKSPLIPRPSVLTQNFNSAATIPLSAKLVKNPRKPVVVANPADVLRETATSVKLSPNAVIPLAVVRENLLPLLTDLAVRLAVPQTIASALLSALMHRSALTVRITLLSAETSSLSRST